jgi:hypothetical protein
MTRNALVVLLALLLCAASAEPLVFDCKIEGRKGSDTSPELLVCSVRQRGELIGTVLLRAPTAADPLWDSMIAPAAVRGMQGDKVFLRLSGGVSPRIACPAGHADVVSTTSLKASDWRSLQVADVHEISETQYLGIVAKSIRP